MMSKLTGHKEITKQAVNELVNSNSQHSVIANLHQMALRYSVQARDIFDVIQLGHWTNSGQRHHFMRSFDGQSHFNAYVDATNWIKSNALQAANQLSNRIKDFGLKSDNFVLTPCEVESTLLRENLLSGVLSINTRQKLTM